MDIDLINDRLEANLIVCFPITWKAVARGVGTLFA